jgi:predicted amidohydrolase YtcJ
MTADTILCNGKVLTVDEDFSIAEAVAIKDGLIAAVGTNDQISKWWGTKSKEIDLAGKTVIPGIIDGHPHLAVEGLRYVYRSRAVEQAIDDVLQGIATEIAIRRHVDWMRTAGRHPPFYQDVPGSLRKNGSNRHDLDKVALTIRSSYRTRSWWNKPLVALIAVSAAPDWPASPEHAAVLS